MIALFPCNGLVFIPFQRLVASLEASVSIILTQSEQRYLSSINSNLQNGRKTGKKHCFHCFPCSKIYKCCISNWLCIAAFIQMGKIMQTLDSPALNSSTTWSECSSRSPGQRELWKGRWVASQRWGSNAGVAARQKYHWQCESKMTVIRYSNI